MGKPIFQTRSKQSVAGVGLELPLLWIEHELEVAVQIDLVPDVEPSEDVQLPDDPRQWIFSPDSGKTRLPVFDTFADRWNNKMLNRTIGQEHQYSPEEIRSGVRLHLGRTFSCPVLSMRISYRVKRRGWLGSVHLANGLGQLDQSEHTLTTKVRLTRDDIPVRRDPGWPEVPDPDAYEATAENVLTVERWDIDTNSLRFTEFGVEQG